MSNPLVSIIIPTYNRAHLIGETLDSVLAQTYKHWECIVVDDGSKDYTNELLEFYGVLDKRIKYYKRPNSRLKGANSCRNYGYEICNGKYVNWFDSDDLMHPEKLELQVNELEKGDLDFVTCKSMVFKNKLNNLKGLRSTQIQWINLSEDYITKKIFLGTIGPLWKKDFISNCDKIFDEELQAAQEWEFFSRLVSKSDKGEAINKSLVFIRQHEKNITNNKEKPVTKWNYFLARYKVYQNENIEKSPKVIKYLENYMLSYFKNVTIEGHFKYAFRAYRMFLWKSSKISIFDKLMGVLALASYILLHRGYYLLSCIDLK